MTRLAGTPTSKAPVKGYATMTPSDKSDSLSWIWAPTSVVDLIDFRDQGTSIIFGSDCWDVLSLELGVKVRTSRLHFNNFRGHHKCLAKELIALQLTGRLWRGDRDTSLLRAKRPQTFKSQLISLRRAIDYLDDRGIKRFLDLTPLDLADYANELERQNYSPKRREALLHIFVKIWEASDQLTNEGMRFRPWKENLSSYQVEYNGTVETLTPVIPEAVLRALLKNALTYILHFSDDIIDAVANIRELRRQSASFRGRRAALEHVDAYLDALYLRYELLPGRRKGNKLLVHHEELSRRLQCCRESLRTGVARGVLHLVARHDGLEEFRPGVITAIPPGYATPWRNNMTEIEIDFEHRNLVIAAYILIGIFTGMRDSEIQALQRGCVSDDGHLINGKIIKARAFSEPHAWAITEPVVKAVKVLERLADVTESSEYLFVKSSQSVDRPTLFREKINRYIRRFADDCTSIAQSLQRAEGCDPDAFPVTLCALPLVDGKRWHLTTSQFRKTFVLFAKSRPFGLVAAGQQLGHQQLRMTEQYVTTSPTGYSVEIAAERFLANLPALSEDHQAKIENIMVSGTTYDFQALVAEEYRRESRMLPGRVVSQHRFDRLKSRKVGSLHLVVFESPSSSRSPLDHRQA